MSLCSIELSSMKLFGGGGEADFENDFMRSRRHSDLLFVLHTYEQADKKGSKNSDHLSLKS